MPRAKAIRGQPRGRYNAKGGHVTIAGKEIWFGSAALVERARQLVALEEEGLIENLTSHADCQIHVKNKLIFTYKVDFVYDVLTPNKRVERRVYEDVKHWTTKDWELKRKLFDAVSDTPLAVIQIPIADNVNPARWMADNWAGRLSG